MPFSINDVVRYGFEKILIFKAAHSEIQFPQNTEWVITLLLGVSSAHSNAIKILMIIMGFNNLFDPRCELFVQPYVIRGVYFT